MLFWSQWFKGILLMFGLMCALRSQTRRDITDLGKFLNELLATLSWAIAFEL